VGTGVFILIAQRKNEGNSLAINNHDGGDNGIGQLLVQKLFPEQRNETSKICINKLTTVYAKASSTIFNPSE
jgi:hypothetical protein